MGTLYALALLATVCQKYFVPSLEVMADYFQVPTDVAGATFMAMGTSAPELFSSVFGSFVSEGDIGVSTVVGSAVFNIVGVTGIIGVLVWKKTVNISWYPVTRDCLMFAATVLTLVIFIWDNSVEWWEALIMLIMFIMYITFMSFNSSVSLWSQNKVRKMKFSSRLKQINPAPLDKDESSPLISGKQPLFDEEAMETPQSSGPSSLEDSTEAEKEVLLMSGHVRKLESQVIDVWTVPQGSAVYRIIWVLIWPGLLLMALTIPDCRQSHLRAWFPLTFLMAIVWTGGLSYVSVWMVTVIGDTFGIPDTISGITLLAVGTSMPEAISSIIVAKHGLGNMAICNLLGSNVFDILFCLGAPWLVKAAFFSAEHKVFFDSAGVSFNAAVLLTLVVVLYLSLLGFRWELDYKIGILCLLLYSSYIVVACLYEMNVFGDVNPFVCS